jgi:hypothetical protein
MLSGLLLVTSVVVWFAACISCFVCCCICACLVFWLSVGGTDPHTRPCPFVLSVVPN